MKLLFRYFEKSSCGTLTPGKVAVPVSDQFIAVTAIINIANNERMKNAAIP